MILSELLLHLQTKNDPKISRDFDQEIFGVSHDSRSVQKGEIFIALTGASFDGHAYIGNAIQQGAIAVVGENDIDALPVPYIQVVNSRAALARISAAFYGFPARELNVIGVTGTDGKTTTVSLIHHILSSCGLKAGMVSTVNARIGNELIDTGFHVTTPEAQKIQSLLRRMVDAGLEYVVVEATSHGLEQFRVDEGYFDVGVVTNITHEHLDYHGDYQHYLLSKSKLFTELAHGVEKSFFKAPTAILNNDDISFPHLSKIISNAVIPNLKILSYGTANDCFFIASNIENTPDGLSFDLIFDGKSKKLAAPLIGEYNVYNILAAISVAVGACGLEIEVVLNAISSFSGVPGRMERIDLGQSFTAIVDFAHTPNALKVALETSRNRTKKRVIAVFGSAGLRDREKRRMMAATSIQIADITIITAEDPRTEDLNFILNEMKDEAVALGGIEGDNLFIVPDRGEAITKAVSLAQAGDLLIACGKGHEQSMCFGEIEYPWDDRIALRSALADHLGMQGPEMPYLPTQDV